MLWHTKGVLCALAYFDILRPKLTLLILMVINFLKVALSQKVLEDFQIAPKKYRKLSWTIKILNMALKNCQLSFIFAFAGLICLQVLQIGFMGIIIKF